MKPSLVAAYVLGSRCAEHCDVLEKLFIDSRNARRSGKRDLADILHRNAQGLELNIHRAIQAAHDTCSGIHRVAFIMGVTKASRLA